MFCKDCPYIIEEFERRIKHAQISEEAEVYCWCEKLGGKVCWYGNCEDGKLLFMENQTSKKIKSNKRKLTNKKERYEIGKYKLQQMSKLYHGAYLKEEKLKKINGKYENVHLNKPYYKRFYRSKKSRYSYYSYLKKYSNKKIRQYKGEISNGNYCKKIYDFWWNVD